MDAPPDLDAELSKLREELLASVASAFDRAAEIGRRQGTGAVLATINDATRKLTRFSGTLTALRTCDGDGAAAPPPGPASREGRARAGAVQEGVLEVLGRSPAPLAPLRIVDAGKAVGLDLKASSVRMALIALSKAGRVEQDARGDYRLAQAGGEAAQNGAPAARTNPA